MWSEFSKDNLDLCLKEPGSFFLVRPKGFHPAKGNKYVPSIVQFIEKQLYSPDNELDPIAFSHKSDVLTPCDDPFECNLEWCELPE